MGQKTNISGPSRTKHIGNNVIRLATTTSIVWGNCCCCRGRGHKGNYDECNNFNGFTKYVGHHGCVILQLLYSLLLLTCEYSLFYKNKIIIIENKV